MLVESREAQGGPGIAGSTEHGHGDGGKKKKKGQLARSSVLHLSLSTACGGNGPFPRGLGAERGRKNKGTKDTANSRMPSVRQQSVSPRSSPSRGGSLKKKREKPRRRCPPPLPPERGTPNENRLVAHSKKKEEGEQQKETKGRSGPAPPSKQVHEKKREWANFRGPKAERVEKKTTKKKGGGEGSRRRLLRHQKEKGPGIPLP